MPERTPNPEWVFDSDVIPREVAQDNVPDVWETTCGVENCPDHRIWFRQEAPVAHCLYCRIELTDANTSDLMANREYCRNCLVDCYNCGLTRATEGHCRYCTRFCPICSQWFSREAYSAHHSATAFNGCTCAECSRGCANRHYQDERATFDNERVYFEDLDDDSDDSDNEANSGYSCYSGYFEADRPVRIHSYNYKPTPVFHGKGPTYLGCELEIHATNRAAMIAESGMGSLAYLKADGSVSDGFEIVTHPMSYPWAMRKFPWEVLPRLAQVGAYPSDDCGMHLHVSRKAFTGGVKKGSFGQTHAYRWLSWFYRNKVSISAIARRESTQWASFYRTDSDKKDMKHLACNGTGNNRYMAVNTTNRTTYEVRVFASSLDKQEIQAAMGLVAGSVEYTRKLTSHQILTDGAFGWGKFMDWAKAQNGLYAPLVKESDKLCAY